MAKHNRPSQPMDLPKLQDYRLTIAKMKDDELARHYRFTGFSNSRPESPHRQLALFKSSSRCGAKRIVAGESRRSQTYAKLARR